MKKIFGILMMLMGLALLGWVAYSKFIASSSGSQQYSPLPPLVFSAGLLYVGFTWVKGKKEDESD